MSKIVLSLLFILSAQTAFANLSSPPDFSGEYAFHGQTKTMAVVHLERVYTLFQDGQNRLAELIGQQYTCEPVGSNFSSCHKVRNDLEVPTSVKQRLTKPYQGRLQLQFGEVTGKPEFHSYGELQWGWTINQKVKLDEVSRLQYRFLHMDNVEKVFIAGKEFLFNQADEKRNTFSFIESISLEDTVRPGYYTYYLELILEPKQL
ncbi:MAG: hypothetical protein ACK5WZ_01400 [Pseudobdellovibrionaceae bacterium]